jgi:hypothetical protein
MSICQWGLELILIVLLGATLFYAMRLERTIGVLRKDRVGLGDVLAAIRTALDDAERGIQSLQHLAEVTGNALTQEIEASAQAQQDIQFLLERLEHAATKAETVIRSGRAAAAPNAPAAPAAPAAPVYSKAERDLLKVLRLSK